MRVTFSLDAFGSHATWEGTIAQISPAAKTIEGVPTFRVTILSKDHDEKFHPGLTASVQVHAEKRENVLIIPRRAIRSSDGKDIVLVRRSSGEVTEQEVKTGLSGSEADIEILEGLQEGDTVVIRPRTR
jgi:HlyD family secretion protein